MQVESDYKGKRTKVVETVDTESLGRLEMVRYTKQRFFVIEQGKDKILFESSNPHEVAGWIILNGGTEIICCDAYLQATGLTSRVIRP